MVIKHGALNEKINRETPSHVTIWSLSIEKRERTYDVEPEEDKKKIVLTVKYDTHLAPVDYGVPVPAVVIHHVDVIQVGVCPVHQLLDHVQCHSSGLLNFIIHQPSPVGAVHVAALHLGKVPIVSEEEHSAEERSV